MNPLKITNKFQDKDVVILASFDPGESTGAVECTLNRLDSDLWQPTMWVHTIPWPEGAAGIRDIVLDANVVIVEEFRVREKEAKSIIGDRLWSAEATGWIVGLVQTFRAPRELIMQAPWAKDFCPPKVVQARLGYWPTLDKKGKAIESHEGDALLHLMYFLAALPGRARNYVWGDK